VLELLLPELVLLISLVTWISPGDISPFLLHL